MRFAIYPHADNRLSFWFGEATNAKNYITSSFTEWIVRLAIVGMDFGSISPTAISVVYRKLNDVWKHRPYACIDGILADHFVELNWYKDEVGVKMSSWKLDF